MAQSPTKYPFNEYFPLHQVHTEMNATTMATTLPSAIAYQQIGWTPEVKIRVITIIVVIAFTFLGNSALILCIACHRKLRRKRVNIFLINLAFGDLMVCFIAMPSEILFVAFGEWVLGAVGCKLIVYGQIVTLASTTFLLTAMSIDRYQVIVQPFKSLTGQPKIWRKVLVAWTLAFVFAIPQLFIFVQTEDKKWPDGTTRYMCRSQGYTQDWQRKLYFTVMTIYVLIIPTTIMTFCYVNIIRVVWMRTGSSVQQPKLRFVSQYSKNRSASNNSSGGGGSGCQADVSPVVTSHRPSRSGSDREVGNNLNIPPRLVSNSKRNVVKMTLSVIIGFVVCWTPYFVISLVRIYSNYTIGLKIELSVAEIMALIHSALNPVLYGIFSTQMAKRAFMDTWRRCRRKEIARNMDFIVSGEDSSFWTEAKIRHMSMTSRMPLSHPLRRDQVYGQHLEKSNCCQKFINIMCCKFRGSLSSAKPLLIYRRADLNIYRRKLSAHQRQLQQQRLDSFQAQNLVVNYSKIGAVFRGAQSMVEEAAYERSEMHLALPTDIPTKSVSDSNIHVMANNNKACFPTMDLRRSHALDFNFGNHEFK